MRLFDRTLKPDYTDLAIVLGPNVRWVEDDYEDLERFAPEVLLGHRVRLAVPHSRLGGYRIHKLVLLLGLDYSNYRTQSMILDAVHLVVPGGSIERYRVHRGYDPVVLRIGDVTHA